MKFTFKNDRFSNLPNELQNLIFSFDTSKRENFNLVLGEYHNTMLMNRILPWSKDEPEGWSFFLFCNGFKVKKHRKTRRSVEDIKKDIKDYIDETRRRYMCTECYNRFISGDEHYQYDEHFDCKSYIFDCESYIRDDDVEMNEDLEYELHCALRVPKTERRVVRKVVRKVVRSVN